MSLSCKGIKVELNLVRPLWCILVECYPDQASTGYRPWNGPRVERVSGRIHFLVEGQAVGLGRGVSQVAVQLIHKERAEEGREAAGSGERHIRSGLL